MALAEITWNMLVQSKLAKVISKKNRFVASQFTFFHICVLQGAVSHACSERCIS